MSKSTKLSFIAKYHFKVFVPVAIILVVLTLAVSHLNLNSVYQHFSNKIKDATGRQIEVSGPITLVLFPKVNLTLNDITIESPTGFSKPLLQANSASVAIGFWSLLFGGITIKHINIEHGILNFIKHADGSSNYIIERKSSEKSKPAPTTDQASENAVAPAVAQPAKQPQAPADTTSTPEKKYFHINKILPNIEIHDFSVNVMNDVKHKDLQWQKIGIYLDVSAKPPVFKLTGQTQMFHSTFIFNANGNIDLLDNVFSISNIKLQGQYKSSLVSKLNLSVPVHLNGSLDYNLQTTVLHLRVKGHNFSAPKSAVKQKINDIKDKAKSILDKVHLGKFKF